MAQSKTPRLQLSSARPHFAWRPFSRSDHTQSPVPHLLESNAVPSQSEVEAIRHFLSDLYHALEVLDAQSPGDTANSSTKKQRETLQKTIALHRSLLSPIRHFPVELIQLIFLYAYDGHTRDYYTLRWKDLPWAISQVSRDWREAAVNLVHFWNHLPNIDLKKISHSGKKVATTIMTELLRRSKGAPLRFSYSCLNTEYGPGDDPVLDALIEHCERWETIHIETTMKTMALALKPIAERLPQLKKLTLNAGPAVEVFPIYNFAVAPALSEVYIINIPTDQIYLPWKQLTHFKENTSKGTTATLVQFHAGFFSNTNFSPCQSPWSKVVPDCLDNLAQLELTRYNTGLPTFRDRTLPNLTALRLRFGLESNGDEVLSNLTLPLLEELVVFRHPGNAIPAIQMLIKRSGPKIKTTLKTMSLRLREFVEGELTELLAMLPQMAKLEIHDPPVTDLQNLVIEADKPILCPNLRLLLLSDLSTIEHIKEIVRDIARTRCEEGCLLDDDDLDHVFAEGQFAQLKTFRMAFGRLFISTSQCYEAQMALNNWNTSLFHNKFSLRLVELAQVLCKEIPAMPSQYDLPNPERRRSLLNPLDLYHATRINDVFSDLEKFEPRDANDIYPSRLHLLLDWISTGPADKIAGESRYHFKARAAALLKKWEPMLKADISNVRWVTLSTDLPGELQYVAPHQMAPERRVGDDAYFEDYGCLLELSMDGIEDVTPQSMWDTELYDIYQW